MWGVEQVGSSVVEHRSPTGSRRRNTETEKTHSGFGEDGSGHADRGLHDDGLNDVGQNVADDDAQVTGSEGAGSFDELAFASGENLAADETRVANPSAERQREDEIEDAGAAECDEGDCEQNSGEGEEGIHQNDIDEAVDASAVVSRDGTDDESEREGKEHDATADEHGDARSVDDARQNVTAQFVGAERVCTRGRVKARRQMNRSRILRSNPGSEHSEDKECND